MAPVRTRTHLLVRSVVLALCLELPLSRVNDARAGAFSRPYHICRWVQRYAPEIEKRRRPDLKRTNDSYRIDETYVRVGGAWKYLYCGVDSNSNKLDFLLRSKRDKAAAITFFRKTLST